MRRAELSQLGVLDCACDESESGVQALGADELRLLSQQDVEVCLAKLPSIHPIELNKVVVYGLLVGALFLVT